MTLRLLFIDDYEDDVLLAIATLERAGIALESRFATTLPQFIAALEEGGWSAVISDYNLGPFTGLDVLREVRSRNLDIPFILVSGTIGEERAADAIREGAHDYVSKDRLGRLPGALRREIDAARTRATRRQLEASLAEVQQRYRNTFEQAPIGIAHGDREGRLLAVNERYAHFLGYEVHELTGRSWTEFVHRDDFDLARHQRFFDESRTHARFDRRFIRKDGSIAWGNVTLSVMRDPNDKPTYVIALVEDITAQKETNQKLLMQSRLLECVGQAVIATDLKGNVTYWNSVAEAMYGWRAEETLGRSILEITPSNQSASDAAAVLERLKQGETWTGEILLARRDGTTFPALVVDSPMYDEAGALIGFVGVSHDLTLQKRVENELRAHKLQLAEAQEIARAGSWTYDVSTGERQWSDALCRLYGFPPDWQPSVEDVFALMPPEDRARLRNVQGESVDNPGVVETEFRVVVDGDERTMVTRVRPLFDDQGNPSKVIGVVQDVTEEKQKAEELRRRTTQQSAVANLGQIALTGASTEFLLEQAVAAVSAVLDVDLTSIFRNDGDFHVIAADGWHGEADARRVVHAGSNSQEEFTIEIGHAVVMTDISLETRFTVAEPLIEQGVASGITVPIQQADGTSWGVLAVHARTRRTYAVYDVEFLRSIATVIGQAIDRTRADAELRTRARQQSAIAKLGSLVLNALDANVFASACELLMSGVGADYAFFGEITPEQTLRLRAGIAWDALPQEIPISASAQAGYTVLHHAPVLVDDYATEERFATFHATVPHGIRSGLMVPVASATRTFGVLSVQSHTPGHFRGEDVDFVQSLANMLAEAMERELVRDAIVESEHRYRRIFDGATEIIFTVDGAGRFVALNAAFESITGWSREEWIGRPFAEVLVEEDRERLNAAFARMIAPGGHSGQASATSEMTLIGKDRLVHVEVSSFARTAAGVVTEIYGFARDVTEARRATAERERVTRNLELLLESTIEGIFTLDLDGRCTMVNRAAAAFLQRPAEELRGQWMHGLLHASVREENCAMLHVLRTGEPCTASSDTFALADGTLMPVAYSAAPIFDAGRHVGVVVTFTDLSEHRKLEARLEQANRLSSLGRLAATVAHEFNNVLMGIAPFVEVIRRAPTPQKLATSLDHIANSVKRGRRITQDILRFTQPAEPVRARVDVASWLQAVSVEARSLLSSAYQVQLDVEPVEVEGDANQLHQIFTNLILNARDAMPSGGKISIAARREPRDARFPFGVLDDPSRYAHFIVRDEGCGMSEETLRHAFEPLFTTKKSGTGLGLAVTHQVVLRHGGEIFIESAVNEGTTFHVFLPLARVAEPVVIPESAGEHPHEERARRILLVEDDVSVSLGLTSLLEYEGFVVSTAQTGAEALVKVRADSYDAVLLDVGLPDMDGQVVYAHIAALHPKLPVIFSTGHADRGKLEELLARPNVSYLLKPYEADSLMDALAQVMSG